MQGYNLFMRKENLLREDRDSLRLAGLKTFFLLPLCLMHALRVFLKAP